MQCQALIESYVAATGTVPEGLWFGPGRVNLIGEHTDYNDGFVLPFALEQRAVIAAGRRDDQRLLVSSVELAQTQVFDIAELAPGAPGWSAYLAGVFWALAEAGHELGGVNLVLTSDVPLGAGLSSSAAIECAAMAALCELFSLEIAAMARAKLAQRAENVYVGAPTGLLDQAASTLCQPDHLLFLDCQDLATELVEFRLAEHGLEVLVLDTHTPHSHVDGEYRSRTDACTAAARQLGLPSLRYVTDLDQALAALSDATLRRRVRHVVTENARVLETVALARRGELRDIGPIMTASHYSMRDDYEITVPTIDLAVEVALAAGSHGSRMTGGGFGGCVITLCDAGAGEAIGARTANEFEAAGFDSPTWFTATARGGAGRLL